MSAVVNRGPRPEEIGAVPLGAAVNHFIGNAATKFDKPAGKVLLVLISEKGTFRLRLGDFTETPPTTPTDDVTDGSGSIALTEGHSLIIPAPKEITVVGSAVDSILTYYWL